MRHTATLQRRENVQAHTHYFATSGQRLLYVAQHLRTPAVFTPQVAISSPQSHKNLYYTVQQALAIKAYGSIKINIFFKTFVHSV
jgi:hypothetical protein